MSTWQGVSNPDRHDPIVEEEGVEGAYCTCTEDPQYPCTPDYPCRCCLYELVVRRQNVLRDGTHGDSCWRWHGICASDLLDRTLPLLEKIRYLAQEEVILRDTYQAGRAFEKQRLLALLGRPE